MGRPPMAQPPGHGHARNAGTSDERSQYQRRGAHGLDDLIFRYGIGEQAAGDGGAVLRAAVAKLDLGAHGDQQFALGLNIAHLRNVFEDDFVFCQDGCGHAGQR